MALLCLLWSVSLHASDHRHDRCRPKQAITWQQKSRSLASYENTRIVSRTSIRSRAGPQQVFFPPDVFLGVEDLGPVGPPWLEYRGPPDIYRDFGAKLWVLGRDGRDKNPRKGNKLTVSPRIYDL
jgi:hypothetical protein